MDKVERLVQLVTLLLDTKVPLPFTAIQRHMPDHYGDPEDPKRDSHKRTFERDKDDLRAMGVPIELFPVDSLVEGEQGYRILKDRYYLPEIPFSPEESAALMVLASDPAGDDPAVRGLRKLIVGIGAGPLASRGSVVAPGPDAAEDRLTPVLEAMRDGRCVTFAYRNAAGERSQRELDPFGLVTRDGHWYIVGAEHGTTDVRAFRTSRVEGEVRISETASVPAPEDFDAAAHVVGPWEAETGEVATIAVEAEAAWWALRTLRNAEEAGVREDGWILLRVPVTGGLAAAVLRFGAAAEVVAPEALRAAVIGSLQEERDRVPG